MYKACIFDLDGTLSDTVESIAYVANQTLEAYGRPTFPVERYKYFAGDGADCLVERCLKAGGDEKLEFYDKVRKTYGEEFDKNPFYKVRIFDGMKETLDELKQRGVKIAVLSNKPHVAAVKVVESLFGEEFFDYIQGQTKEVPRKPDPIGCYTIMKKFHMQPEDFLYIGDTNTDMQTGKAADMYTVGVTWGFRDRQELEENHADAIIDHPQELLKILAES